MSIKLLRAEQAPPLRVRAVAFLVLLAASTGTRIVSAHFRLVPANRLHRGIVAADSRRLRCFRRGLAERKRWWRCRALRRSERRRRTGRRSSARVVENQWRTARRRAAAGRRLVGIGDPQ